MTRRATGLLVPVIALIAVIASGGWLAAQQPSDGYAPGDRMMTGAGMMWATGSGRLEGEMLRVRDLADARDRADGFARKLEPGLRVGEVMRFSNHYYAELLAPDGSKATEVLVDPRTGAVGLEPGPAMRWNTRFGMMAAGPDADAELTPDAARAVAARWLRARGGLAAGEAEAFPGYYTMHTLRDGRVEGMLSVHAVTGAVWYHGWHGRFLEMSEGE